MYFIHWLSFLISSLIVNTYFMHCYSISCTRWYYKSMICYGLDITPTYRRPSLFYMMTKFPRFGISSVHYFLPIKSSNSVTLQWSAKPIILLPVPISFLQRSLEGCNEIKLPYIDILKHVPRKNRVCVTWCVDRDIGWVSL